MLARGDRPETYVCRLSTVSRLHPRGTSNYGESPVYAWGYGERDGNLRYDAVRCLPRHINYALLLLLLLLPSPVPLTNTVSFLLLPIFSHSPPLSLPHSSSLLLHSIPHPHLHHVCWLRSRHRVCPMSHHSPSPLLPLPLPIL